MLHATVFGSAKNPTVFLLHGWPDCAVSVFQRQIAVLSPIYRVVAVDLPGYETVPRDGLPSLGYNISEVGDMYYKTILHFMSLTEEPDARRSRPMFIAHDWGSVVTQCMLHEHPEIAAKVVLLDVGKGMDKRVLATIFVLAYQMSLIFFWLLPSVIGTPLTRGLARVLGAPNVPSVRSHMNYLYVRTWVNLLTRTMPASLQEKGAPRYKGPLLYAFAEKKPALFHSQSFLRYVSNDAPTGSKVLALPLTDHWFFARGSFVESINKEILDFLARV